MTIAVLTYSSSHGQVARAHNSSQHAACDQINGKGYQSIENFSCGGLLPGRNTCKRTIKFRNGWVYISYDFAGDRRLYRCVGDTIMLRRTPVGPEESTMLFNGRKDQLAWQGATFQFISDLKVPASLEPRSDESGLITEKRPPPGRLLPYYQDGRIIGFKVIAIRAQGLFEQIGLNNGDVILSIDKKPVTSVETLIPLLMYFQTKKQVELNILRDGQPKTIASK